MLRSSCDHELARTPGRERAREPALLGLDPALELR